MIPPNAIRNATKDAMSTGENNNALNREIESLFTVESMHRMGDVQPSRRGSAGDRDAKDFRRRASRDLPLFAWRPPIGKACRAGAASKELEETTEARLISLRSSYFR